MIVGPLHCMLGYLLWLDRAIHTMEKLTWCRMWRTKHWTKLSRLSATRNWKGWLSTPAMWRCARRHGIRPKSSRRSTREGGRTIYLTVTTSKVPLVKLPDLIDNSSLRQAEAKLKAMGFKLTEPEYVSGEQDWIYGIKYRGRSLLAEINEAAADSCVGNTAIRDSLAIDSTRLSIWIRLPTVKLSRWLLVLNLTPKKRWQKIWLITNWTEKRQTISSRFKVSLNCMSISYGGR